MQFLQILNINSFIFLKLYFLKCYKMSSKFRFANYEPLKNGMQERKKNLTNCISLKLEENKILKNMNIFFFQFTTKFTFFMSPFCTSRFNYARELLLYFTEIKKRKKNILIDIIYYQQNVTLTNIKFCHFHLTLVYRIKKNNHFCH